MSDPTDRQAAPPPAAAIPAPPKPPVDSPGWPRQATDTIVDVVAKVRDKTTGPITKIARYVVYGTFALLAGVVALVLVAILAVRVLNNYVTGHNVWIAHLIVSVPFLGAAVLCFGKALAKPKPAR